jgi:vacuolar-type H+-ATPase subunit I/STV1
MRYATPRIIQPGERNPFQWLLLLLAMLLGVAAGWYGGHFVEQRQGSSRSQLVAQLAAEKGRAQALEQERAALQEQVAMLERSAQIDQEAVRKVREQLASFQEERSKLEEELTILRSMAAAKDSRDAVRVQRLKVTAGPEERSYHYRFTVTQSMQNGDMANGWVFFAVDGLQDGKPKWLPLREITKDNVERLKMRFKNFQDIEGDIRLPEGFKPLKIIVEVKPSNKKITPVKQRFDWKISD